MSTRRSLDTGVAALCAQQRRGWWRDYDMLGEVSDEYVTAYTAVSLVAVPGAGQAVEGAWAALAARSAFRGPGWGWNLSLPSDADVTSFVLALAQAVGRSSEQCALRGGAFVSKHVGPDGVQSYLPGPRVVSEEWQHVHHCVTASACGEDASLRPELAAVVSSQQESDGSWSGYWWPSRDYPTGMSVLALPIDQYPDEITAAARWVLRQAEPDGAFPAAWRLLILLKASSIVPGLTATAKRLVDLLIGTQGADGMWPGSAIMQVPGGQPGRPWPFPSILRDEAGILTTATALRALNRTLAVGDASGLRSILD